MHPSRPGLKTGELLFVALATVMCPLLASCGPKCYRCHIITGDYAPVSNGRAVQETYFHQTGGVEVEMTVCCTKPNAWNTGDVHEVHLYLALANKSFDSLSFALNQIEISSTAGAYKMQLVWVQGKRRDEDFECKIMPSKRIKITFLSRLEGVQRLPDSVVVKLGSIVVESTGERIPLGDAVFRPSLE